MTDLPPVTTEEIEAVRSARYSHPDMGDACRVAGIARERVAQFNRIFAQMACNAADARQAAGDRRGAAKRGRRWR